MIFDHSTGLPLILLSEVVNRECFNIRNGKLINYLVLHQFVLHFLNIQSLCNANEVRVCHGYSELHKKNHLSPCH
jgi:hypothetical protein